MDLFVFAHSARVETSLVLNWLSVPTNNERSFSIIHANDNAQERQHFLTLPYFLGVALYIPQLLCPFITRSNKQKNQESILATISLDETRRQRYNHILHVDISQIPTSTVTIQPSAQHVCRHLLLLSELRQDVCQVSPRMQSGLLLRWHWKQMRYLWQIWSLFSDSSETISLYTRSQQGEENGYYWI